MAGAEGHFIIVKAKSILDAPAGIGLQNFTGQLCGCLWIYGTKVLETVRLLQLCTACIVLCKTVGLLLTTDWSINVAKQSCRILHGENIQILLKLV